MLLIRSIQLRHAENIKATKTDNYKRKKGKKWISVRLSFTKISRAHMNMMMAICYIPVG